MSLELRPYPEYKNSRLPQLDRVPAHWVERRAKYLYREVDDRSDTGDDELLSVSHLTGVTPRSQKNVTMFHAESYIGHKRCRPADLVINTMWAWMGALGVSRFEGIVSPSYAVYRRRGDNSMLSEYADRLLRTPQYISEYVSRSTGIRSSRLRLYPEQFLDIPIVQPPMEEQEQIEDFLSGMDRLMRRLIRAKRRQIELLNEQKQAIIHQAVTRGLDPDVPLKPSGIDWLGDVPAHWQIRRLKHLARMKSGESITSTDIDESGAYPVYGGNGLRGFTRSYTHDGDFILIGRQGALCGNIHYARGQFWASEHAVVATPSGTIQLRWLGELLRAMKLNQYSIAAAQPGLAVERILNLAVPFPVYDEQAEIADRIEHETQGLDRIAGRIEREIDLIREYRTRLIADVVTGKLDVRGVELPGGDATDDAAWDETDDELDDTMGDAEDGEELE